MLLDRVISNKYRIERVVGAGGMGVVCEAVHETTKKRVALKLISVEQSPLEELAGESVSTTQDAIARFEREARAVGAIDTDHVVQVYDAGVDDDTGTPYLAMELLEGESLQGLLQRVGLLEPEAAVRIALQACRGLMAAHDAGIVHRDIKPANLFLSRRGEAIVLKILDFGIAKIVDDERELTRTGSILGSPRYMAPEQVKGLKTIDQRADIWSLAVVLYRMLAGRTPHDAESDGQLLLAICTRRPKHLQDVAPWVDAATAEVVHRALQLNPKKRYQSAAQLRDALAALIDHSDIAPSMLQGLSEERRSTTQQRVEVDRGDPLRDAALGATLPPRERPKRWPVTLIGIASLLLLAWWLSRETTPATETLSPSMPSPSVPSSAPSPAPLTTALPTSAMATSAMATTATSVPPSPPPAPSGHRAPPPPATTASAPPAAKDELDVSRTLD